jgi:hypothetical protein
MSDQLRPPAGLNARYRAQWHRFHRLYEFGPDAEAQLQVLLEACQRRDHFRQQVRAEGNMIVGRYTVAGAPVMRAHPLLPEIRGTEANILRAARELGLDLAEADAPARRNPTRTAPRPTLLTAVQGGDESW